MAAIIVILVGGWVIWLLYGSAEKRREMLDEISARNSGQKPCSTVSEAKTAASQPNSDSEEDELFNTDLGDFDDTFGA